MPHRLPACFDSAVGRSYPAGNTVFAETRAGGSQHDTHGGDMGQFGQELRREREVRGVSVDTVCAATKVSLRHVLALEEGRFEELPGGVFRKGILRSYLNAVGLDETAWLERYESTVRELGDGAQQQDWAEFAENVHRNRVHEGPPTGLRWLGVALMVLGLLACGWAAWRFVVRNHLAPPGSFLSPATSISFPAVGPAGKIEC